MTTLWLDLETYSETPITNGTYRYAQDAEVMLVAWALDDAPVQVWDVTEGAAPPAVLLEAVEDWNITLAAHNTMFDRTVLRYAANVPWQFRNAALCLDRWQDTMVKALAHSLPGKLDLLCEILGVPQDERKQKVGGSLVQMFCKPRPKTSKLARYTRVTHPEEWRQFKDYAAHDISAMRAIDKKLPNWNYRDAELALWRLDQQINDRGIAVDMDLARAALRGVSRAQRTLAARTADITGGRVASTTQRDQLLKHILAEYGVELPDMQGATIERRAADPELPLELRELLAIRLQAATSSTSKYTSLLRAANNDGRLRGTLQFCGAQRTGRWAGRTFQPQNLPRPVLKQETIDFGIEALKADADDLLFDNVMELASSAIRGCIVAPPGRKLCVSDLSNIEGRKAAWLAGEAWKLKAFADFDAGIGSDLYKVAYAKAFALASPEDVTKPQRQIGKVMELMLQYEGGVGAFLTGAATYGIDLDAMADAALPNVPPDVLRESSDFYEWTVRQKRSTFGLKRETFIACDALKRLWRRAHPAISSYWPELRAAAVEAIANPNVAVPCRRLRIARTGAWLRVVLPSGRTLCYPSPQVADDGSISYMGINQYTRKWSRLKTYGGKLLENVTQAAARDVMAANMPLIEREGYQIVLSVHDELLTETDDCDAYSDTELSRLLATCPPWAEGLPLAAGGFSTYRYKKD